MRKGTQGFLVTEDLVIWLETSPVVQLAAMGVMFRLCALDQMTGGISVVTPASVVGLAFSQLVAWKAARLRQ